MSTAKDLRASSLEEGMLYREYGDDELRRITRTDQHGDTVLIWYDTDEDTGYETTHDIDEVVEVQA